ncbi:MAG: alpha/beta hydrolase [Clostridiales bacterium]|nr:alpha/beta hydrolase [Clostridiales bacterium]
MSQASDTVRREFKKGDDIRDAGLTTPEDVQRFDDICYGEDADWQVLDVYRPKEKAGEVLPVIISVHGGGWVYGDKERYQYYCMSLAQRGFAVVNFTYRLAPEFKFPASQEDTNLVVSWVLSHAEEYGMDAEHVFMVGDSAGAHGTGLYAAICTNPEYAAQFPFTVPEGFRPTAIALNCGTYSIADRSASDGNAPSHTFGGRTKPPMKSLRDEAASDGLTMALMEDLFEDGATEENMEKICVPNYITENYVPTYFMTCTGDFLKPQAPLLFNKLMECNVPFEFQFYGDKDHELGHVFHCNMKLEIAAKCNDAQCEFFRKFL